MTTKPQRIALVKQAIELAGGTLADLAAATGFSSTTIWKALTNGVVSPQLATAIENVTKGAIKRYHVCSDREVFAGLGLPEKPDKPFSRIAAA